MQFLCIILLYCFYAKALADENQDDLLSNWRTNGTAREEVAARFFKSCYGECFNSSGWTQMYDSMHNTHREIVGKFSNETISLENMALTLSSQDRDRICQMFTNAQSCINACPAANYRDDESNKAQAKSTINIFFRLCDQDIKDKFDCLITVWKANAQTCTQCETHRKGFANKSVWLKNNQVINTGEIQNEFLLHSCKFLNCQLNCQKSKIIDKCNQEGYEAAKKMLLVASDFVHKFRAETPFYTQTGSVLKPNLPAECKGDRLTQEN